MVDMICQFYCDHQSIDRVTLGKSIRNVTAMILNRAPSDIKESGLKCCNIRYEDVIKDPVNTVKSIYAFYGWDYSEEYDTILREYIRRDDAERADLRKDKKGRHAYSLDMYGLEASDFDEESSPFAQYMKQFGLKQNKK